MSFFDGLMSLPPYVSVIFLALLSLAVGSLLNVIIYRLPLMLESEWRKECCNLLKQPELPTKKINLFLPRSFCPTCNMMITAWQNIPLISYLFLRGRCASCKTHISFFYPFVELLCLGLSLLAASHFGFNLILLFALLFIWILIPLCFIDLKHQILPDSLTLTLLWLGLFANTENLFTTLPEAVFSAALGYLFLWLFIKIFYLITGKVGMGNGDFKLFAAFGAWFGWSMLPLILMISSLTGSIVGLIYLKFNHKTRETPIPFGPFLCFSGLFVLFYGNSVVNWYLQYV